MFDPLQGVSASDNVDGDLTSSIQVTGAVDSTKAGRYALTYQVADAAGNTASAQRLITVAERQASASPPNTKDPLANTGVAEIIPALALGVLLLLGGAIIVWQRRTAAGTRGSHI